MLEDYIQLPSKPIQRFSQRPPPALMVVRITAVAAAVASPAFHAVRAAPRSVLAYLYFVRWWMKRKILAVVRYTREAFPSDLTERIRQGHLAKLEMMPKGFAVRCDAHQLSMLATIMEAGHQSFGKPVTAPQQVLEGNVVRHRRVVEEQIDVLPVVQLTAISPSGIDSAV